MTTTNKEPFTVQAGKRYNRRDGSIHKIVEDDGAEQAPLCSDTDHWYGRDGRSCTSDRSCDLISEYIEPTEVNRVWRDTTAEPQDEWGPLIPWMLKRRPEGLQDLQRMQAIYYNGDGELCSDARDGGGDRGVGSHIWNHESPVAVTVAYRIKKEPVVMTDYVWIDEKTCDVWDEEQYDGERMAIITLTDGKPSIRWADEGEDQ